MAKQLQQQPPETNFDAEIALTGYDERYLTCRDLRHTWQNRGYYRADGLIRRKLTCDRCGATRIDGWRDNGERVNPSYEHPEGYVLQGGHVKGIDVRREQLHRITVFDSLEDLTSHALNGRRLNRRK